MVQTAFHVDHRELGQFCFGLSRKLPFFAFDVRSLLTSFLGAVILLAIVNLFRRGAVR